MVTTFIYSLIDPLTKNVMYVGKSSNPKRRFKSHLLEKHNFKKLNWLRSLKEKGLLPELFIIDEVDVNEWEFWEIHYISLFRSFGFNLCNLNKGGFGGHEDHIDMAEIKVKQRNSKLKDLKNPDNYILKNLERANETRREIGYAMTPEATEKWLNTRRSNGKPWHTQETIDKYANTLRGRTRNPDAVAKMIKTNSIPVVQLTMNGEFIKEWESMKHAVMALDIKGHAVYDVLHKKVGRKSYKGNKWMLKSEWELIEIN